MVSQNGTRIVALLAQFEKVFFVELRITEDFSQKSAPDYFVIWDSYWRLEYMDKANVTPALPYDSVANAEEYLNNRTAREKREYRHRFIP